MPVSKIYALSSSTPQQLTPQAHTTVSKSPDQAGARGLTKSPPAVTPQYGVLPTSTPWYYQQALHFTCFSTTSFCTPAPKTNTMGILQTLWKKKAKGGVCAGNICIFETSGNLQNDHMQVWITWKGPGIWHC